MLIFNNLAITIIAFVILAFWVIVEVRFLHKDSHESDEKLNQGKYHNELLNAIAKHQGIDTTEIEKKYCSSFKNKRKQNIKIKIRDFFRGLLCG